MWKTLRTLLSRTPPPPPPSPWDDVTHELRQLRGVVAALEERTHKLERERAQAAAEHLAALDALERLYRRVTARIARSTASAETPADAGESVLALRRRIGK